VTTKLRVIVASYGTSRFPEFAGSAWVRLQYMLGLQRLGVECYWVDRLSEIDPLTHHHSLEYVTSRFAGMAARFGFEDRFCIIYNDGERYFGLSEEELNAVVDGTDLLLNISGHLMDDSVLMRIPRRAYVDVDPGFTQMWGDELLHFSTHNYFFTTGQNVGTCRFPIATNGIDWVSILPPVALQEWPDRTDERCTRISTVADWHASQGALFQGEIYGGKQSEFIRYLRVPLEVDRDIEVAMLVHPYQYADQKMLAEHGWSVLDPFKYTGDTESYREFIQFSRAEFSVAKEGYVKSNSGWVSDRTACYLASGKPAVVQSTGFEITLPTGKGLLSFATQDEAIDGLQRVDANYLEHCRAARALAEQYFNSDVVLGRILKHVGLG
jgi:hypothetical protein